MAEGGTLLQLQYLINRTNVPSKMKKDVNAAQDFFETVVIAHVVAAAMQFFNMKTVQDKPASAIFSQLLAEDNIESRKKLFHSALVGMVRNFLNITPFDIEDEKDDDKVRAYAKEVFSLGTLLFELDDSIHEGDGDRLLRVWKVLLLIFRSAKKTKYALESLLLLIQAHTLPPRLKQQLLYSRFVNIYPRSSWSQHPSRLTCRTH